MRIDVLFLFVMWIHVEFIGSKYWLPRQLEEPAFFFWLVDSILVPVFKIDNGVDGEISFAFIVPVFPTDIDMWFCSSDFIINL